MVNLSLDGAKEEHRAGGKAFEGSEALVCSNEGQRVEVGRLIHLRGPLPLGQLGLGRLLLPPPQTVIYRDKGFFV